MLVRIIIIIDYWKRHITPHYDQNNLATGDFYGIANSGEICEFVLIYETLKSWFDKQLD